MCTDRTHPHRCTVGSVQCSCLQRQQLTFTVHISSEMIKVSLFDHFLKRGGGFVSLRFRAFQQSCFQHVITAADNFQVNLNSFEFKTYFELLFNSIRYASPQYSTAHVSATERSTKAIILLLAARYLPYLPMSNCQSTECTRSLVFQY